VHFRYEYRDDSGQWYRAFGNEHWVFDEDGLMSSRDASINEVAIRADQREIALDGAQPREQEKPTGEGAYANDTGLK